MDLNERIISITGGACFFDEIDTQKDIDIKGTLDIYSVAKVDRQDGTYDLKYKGKFIDAIELTQGQKKIIGRDKTGKSKKLRGAIYSLGQAYANGNDEMFYETVMNKIIVNLEEIWMSIRNK